MCKYCKSNLKIEFLTAENEPVQVAVENIAVMYNEENWVLSAADKDDMVFVKINYCPICGEKLYKGV